MTIPTYPIEPRDYEAEHVFVVHFNRMFKNLVRQYLPEYPTTEQGLDLLYQIQDRTSCFSPYVWDGPASDSESTLAQQPDVLLRMALQALQYHVQQTRPIHKTAEVMQAIQTYLDVRPR